MKTKITRIQIRHASDVYTYIVYLIAHKMNMIHHNLHIGRLCKLRIIYVSTRMCCTRYTPRKHYEFIEFINFDDFRSIILLCRVCDRICRKISYATVRTKIVYSFIGKNQILQKRFGLPTARCVV